MIDTIILTLKQGEYTLFQDYFHPSATSLEGSGVKAGDKVVQNTTPTERKLGIYKPRLTIYARPDSELKRMTRQLKIEFSAPKLLFKNNFEELSETDFELLITTLIKALRDMGVYVFREALTKSVPSGIHFSRNFILTSGITSSMVITELSRADVTRRLDSNKARYRNEGHGFAWHTSSYEVVCYDKVKDLEQAKISPLRAFESGNQLQLPLLDVFPKFEPFEVFRFEVRLDRRRLKLTLSKLNVATTFALQELCTVRVSQAILLHFWKECTNGLEMSLGVEKETANLFHSLRILNLGLKPAKLLQYTAALQIIGQKGMRAARLDLEQVYGKGWFRFKKELTSIQLPKQKFRAYQEISKQITVYVPVRFANYPQLVLANDKERLEQKNNVPNPYND